RRDHSEEHSQREPLIGQIHENDEDDEYPIEKSTDTIPDKPDTLTRRGMGNLRLLAAKGITLTEIADVLIGPLAKIGNLRKIPKHVVPVELKQGICIEDDGRNPGNHDGIIGQGADGTWFDAYPHQDGDRRDD